MLCECLFCFDVGWFDCLLLRCPFGVICWFLLFVLSVVWCFGYLFCGSLRLWFAMYLLVV